MESKDAEAIDLDKMIAENIRNKTSPSLKRDNPDPSLPDQSKDAKALSESSLKRVKHESDSDVAADESEFSDELESGDESVMSDESSDSCEERFKPCRGLLPPLGITGLPPLDDRSQILAFGEVFYSILDLLYKRFRFLAKKLVFIPRLVVLARQFLEMIEKPDTYKGGFLDKTASELMENKAVINGLIELANMNRRFCHGVGCCFSYATNRKEWNQETENVNRLRGDCVFELLMKNLDTDENVLRGALSIVFGYWIEPDFFYDKRSLCAAFKNKDDDEDDDEDDEDEDDHEDFQEDEDGDEDFQEDEDGDEDFQEDEDDDEDFEEDGEKNGEFQMEKNETRKKAEEETQKQNTTPHTNGEMTTDAARECAKRIVRFVLEQVAEGSFVPEPRGSLSTVSPEFLERLTHKITLELNQLGLAAKEHTPHVAPVSRNESCVDPQEEEQAFFGS